MRRASFRDPLPRPLQQNDTVRHDDGGSAIDIGVEDSIVYVLCAHGGDSTRLLIQSLRRVNVDAVMHPLVCGMLKNNVVLLISLQCGVWSGT